MQVKQLSPVEENVPLEGLYWRGENDLKEIYRKTYAKLGRPLVIANYISDKNGVIAYKEEYIEKMNLTTGPPETIKNTPDWKRFQELQAQADIIITGTGYLNRVKKLGDKAQNVLNQFDKGAKYEALGDKRLAKGYKSRNPDIAVTSRSLDFEIPEGLITENRRFFVFTTHDMENSEKAESLRNTGAIVVGCGEKGVDGKSMIKRLGEEGYEIVKMTTGPSVLQILIDGNVLDRLYVTEVQTEIQADSENLVTIPASTNTVPDGFTITQSYLQEGVITDAGTVVNQLFKVYEHKDLAAALS